MKNTYSSFHQYKRPNTQVNSTLIHIVNGNIEIPNWIEALISQSNKKVVFLTQSILNLENKFEIWKTVNFRPVPSSFVWMAFKFASELEVWFVEFDKIIFDLHAYHHLQSYLRPRKTKFICEIKRAESPSQRHPVRLFFLNSWKFRGLS